MGVSELLNFEQIIGLLALGFGYLLYLQWHEFKHLPAGPWGLPIVGYLPFLGNKPYETFLRLGQKYGSVFSITIGSCNAVVLNDWAAVRAALVEQSDNFAVRPPIFVFDSTINKKDVTNVNGPLMKKCRHFYVQTLKPYSMQKSVRESVVMESVNNMIDILSRFDGQIHELHSYFFLTILNIIWRMASSRVVSDSDAKLRELFKIMRMNFEGLRGDSPLNFMPWLRYVVPGGCGHWNHLKNHNLLMNFLKSEVDEHLKFFDESTCNDFIDAYLAEIKKQDKITGTQKPPFTMEFLLGALYDLFLAGTETSTSTLMWGFLILALKPDIQEKVQAEMDEVVGRGRLPCFEDQANLPYLEAVIMEIHRFATVVHFSILHTCRESTTILGQPVPKGTIVIEHIYGVHRDPKLWEKPNEFWPERFFDKDNKLIRPEYLIPFSIGGRKCIGEPIAKVQLFSVFSCLLHKFSFQIPPNTPAPSLEDIDIALTRNPKPYSLLISSR